MALPHMLPDHGPPQAHMNGHWSSVHTLAFHEVANGKPRHTNAIPDAIAIPENLLKLPRQGAADLGLLQPSLLVCVCVS